MEQEHLLLTLPKLYLQFLLLCVEVGVERVPFVPQLVGEEDSTDRRSGTVLPRQGFFDTSQAKALGSRQLATRWWIAQFGWVHGEAVALTKRSRWQEVMMEVLHLGTDAVVKAGVEMKRDIGWSVDDGGGNGGDWSALGRLRDGRSRIDSRKRGCGGLRFGLSGLPSIDTPVIVRTCQRKWRRGGRSGSGTRGW
jgi:hypothetical protein